MSDIFEGTIYLSGKCSDLSNLVIQNRDGYEFVSHEGYVPSCGLGYGDYIEVEVDNVTGKVVGWKPLTCEDVLAIKDKE